MPFARRAKNAGIAEEKKKKAAEREGQKAQAEKESADKQAKQAEIDKKREENVAKKEKKRDQSSKYSKKDIMELKGVFDTYDKDKNGQLQIGELKSKMEENKRNAAPREGMKSTLAQRQAAAGISIVDMIEASFSTMDLDGDGSVTFEVGEHLRILAAAEPRPCPHPLARLPPLLVYTLCTHTQLQPSQELLKIMYPNASKDEFKTMLSWVHKEPEPEPVVDTSLSDEAKEEIKGDAHQMLIRC